MDLIEGKTLAAEIRVQVKKEITQTGLTPGLAVILVGDDPPSHTYVELKKEAAEEVGIRFTCHFFPVHANQDEIMILIHELNARMDIHAILIQLPLPPHLDPNELIRAISSLKDADGFHPTNMQLLQKGAPRHLPVVARAALALLKATHQSLQGKHAVLAVKSDIFSLSLSFMLSREGCKAETVKLDDPHFKQKTTSADIIITAIGNAHYLTADYVKPGATIIDIGTTVLPGGGTKGDADPVSLSAIPGFRSVVPGGIGPLTVAYLMQTTLELAKIPFSSPLPKNVYIPY
ncbi:MAG: bifunctional 5,10-methylenetetrahydrofolate dehydrogenase/5,10-methenyltetrahydrofolate cyclohydrolase [Patescibacteria group bacterium]